MSGSLRYDTDDSSKEVLRHLYDRNAKTPFYECRINVSAPRLDETRSGSVVLYITRLRETGSDYIMANGDRVYRSTARIDPDGEAFDVDVIIRSREASYASATISVSSEVNRIIANRR